MTTATLAVEQRVVLNNVSWEGYESCLKELKGRAVRITFDRGELEIMVVSHGHENYGKLLARFVETLTEELGIPIHSGKSTTCKQEKKRRGLEADESYWIENEPRMRGRKDFDLATDSPPDLALEVEISRSALNRMAIYAALGVPEVWRFDGHRLYVHRLGADGKYSLCESSPTFPDLPLSEVLRFLHESDTVDETTLIRSFRKWVRQHVLPAWEERQRARSRPRRGNGRRRPR
jgi:Uma2 family endonuclease